MTKMAADIEYGATEEEQWDMISKLMSTSTKAIQPHVSMIQSALKKLCIASNQLAALPSSCATVPIGASESASC